MNRKLLFVIIVWLPKLLIGQDLDNRVRQYYLLKQKAELAIIDSCYRDALVFYKRAFNLKAPNARDLYNASRLSIIQNDSVAAQTYINSLILHGLERRMLEQWFGNNLIDSKSLYSFVTKNYDSLHNKFITSDIARKGSLLSPILKRDQEIRRTSASKEQTAEKDKENIDSLIAFINKNGFPSFDNVGFADPFAGIGLGGVFYMVYWHNRSNDNRLDSIGMRAALNGEYPPDEFAEVYDLKYFPSKYQMLVPGLAEMDRQTEHLSTATVNTYRRNLYLENLDEYKRKLLFMNMQKPYYFSFLLTPQLIYGMNFAKITPPKK